MDVNTTTAAVTTSGESKQYIVINLGKEQYGIDIGYVDNIVRMQNITRVPKAPVYFKGVINLRGEIVPVMSLRKKFELEDDVYTDKSRIIIIKSEQQDKIGVIIDMVKEVINVSEEDIDKMAIDSKDDKSKYIIGVGKHNDTLISLLNINNVIAIPETQQ